MNSAADTEYGPLPGRIWSKLGISYQLVRDKFLPAPAPLNTVVTGLFVLFGSLDSDRTKTAAVGEFNSKSAVRSYARSAFATWYFQLLNCRNVRKAEAGSVDNRLHEKTLRRLGRSVIWRTTLLPGQVLSPAGLVSGDFMDPKRLHSVRGHFKTYTTDNPLLGKHVGTFFWPSHVRGDREVGEVFKTYEEK